MSTRLDSILNPITALQFYRRDQNKLFLIAGEGPYLKVYDSNTSLLLLQHRIFSEQVIHGISTLDKQEDIAENGFVCIAIWGGTSLALLTKVRFDLLLDQVVNDITDLITLVPDWILDAAISPFEPNNCALVTAHNAIILASVQPKYGRLEWKTVFSPSKLILYSAHLIWESKLHVIVASGTAFGQIITWKCFVDGTKLNICTLAGHEGSVFGIKFSPTFTHADGRDGRLLASCSDDRTVRVWDFMSDHSTKAATEILDAEEAGLKVMHHEIQDSTSQALAVFMGHASRIWHLQFLFCRPTSDDQMLASLLSFGEDATTQQWVLKLKLPSAHNKIVNGDSRNFSVDINTSEIIHHKSYAFHSGKHIWSSALCKSIDGWILGTGGADGKIAIYPIRELDDLSSLSKLALKTDSLDQSSVTNSWIFSDILSLVKETNIESKSEEIKLNKISSKDTFNRYIFLSTTEILVTTTLGHIMRGLIGSQILWAEVQVPESISVDLRSYAVVKGFTKSGIGYLAGVSGMIYSYTAGLGLSIFGCVNGKVADMFTINDKSGQLYGLIVTTLTKKTATFFQLDRTSHKIIETLDIGLPPKFVITSAGVANQLLVLGSRLGSLIVYDPKNLGSPLEICNMTRELSGDAITSILPLSPAGLDCSTEYFLTTGRNGFYFIFSIALQHGQGTISSLVRMVHHGTPPFGPIIDNAWFEDNELILFGFKGTKFIVWNETRQLEIMSCDCGGAHRSYAYSSMFNGGGGHFVYTRSSKLYLLSHDGPSHKILKQGAHGREIKACALSSDHQLVATGAEDTSLRIWRYDRNAALEERLQCRALVQKHTTGIQHLQWLGSNYLLSSGGNEEFFIWAITSIPNFGVGLVCEASWPDQSEAGNRRITCFEATTISTESPEDGIIVSMGLSDSAIYSYQYSKNQGFSVLATGQYTSSCITQIRQINVSTTSIFLITAATDGILTLWNADITKNNLAQLDPVNLVPHNFQKLHQGTIKSLDVRVDEQSMAVLTGGDDGALVISIFNHLALHEKPNSFRLDGAHAAAITCLSVLQSSTDERLNLITTSNDQRVKTWYVNVLDLVEEKENHNISLAIELEQEQFTTVADAGGLAVIGESCLMEALIVGNGMEVIGIPSMLPL
ncbi:WD 40 repeat protein [Blumeria hordei DH14]|uniref:WD 40 repeat protein n=1 Tax=Blumeria graminis f. sp. hordei (strain DH14) TaxID=546991 RepID=N1JIL2_BLUG1|nr:WD 40 repeat protein [Blumeria hordei DH14]